MYYKDLSFYRIDGEEDLLQFYPNVKNVGWLDKAQPYQKGSVKLEQIKKIKELTFLDLKNQDDMKNGVFDEKQALIVDQMLTRGSPFPCPFCQEVINLAPNEVEIYSGERIKVLGLNEIIIPSVDRQYVYSCPSLIYHYIHEHEYLPPSEFLEALDAFELNKPYNSSHDIAFEFCIDVPRQEIDLLNEKNIHNYPESNDC